MTVCLSTVSGQDEKKEKLITIRGKVITNLGEPLFGALVWSGKGDNGTTTDENGNYVLEAVPANGIVSYSFMMERVDMPVNGRAVINVELKTENKELDEVVVIGYGTAKRSDITGSTAGLKMEDAIQGNMLSLESALKGRISGVRVLSDNSPGGSISIQIRGANSMLGGTEPLYVIDGFPMEPIEDAQGNNEAGDSQVQSAMSYLNPDDIEHIEILKDASATAIYGARGANGVVLITTKRGSEQGFNISYNAKFNISTIAKKLDVMSAEEWATNMNQRELNRYYIESTAPAGIMSGSVSPISLPYDGIKNPLPWDLPNDTDWQDAIYRTAFSHNHSVQISGGNRSNRYSVNFGYTNQNGIILNSDYERYTINTNYSNQITRKLKFVNNINASYAFSKAANTSNGEIYGNRGVVTSALMMQPIFALNYNFQDPNEDDYYLDLNNGQRLNNPYTLVTKLIDDKTNYSLVESFELSYEIIDNLILTGKAGVNYSRSERGQYWPISTTRGKSANGVASTSYGDLFKILSEVRLNYNFRIKKSHIFDVMAATTYEQNNRKSNYSKYENFPSDDLGYYQLGSALSLFPPDIAYSENKLNSYLGRINYKYSDRYYVTATLRADGSTRFAKNKKWGLFPSLALAWRISEEKFMKDTFVDNLKVRFSIGSTGSESGIAPYRSLGILSENQYTFNDNKVPGYVISNIPNPELTWETTNQIDLGIDGAFFNSKLMVTIDAYYKRTLNMLQNVSLPPSFGFTSKLMNMGEIENKGIEFNISIPVIAKTEISWLLSFNGSINRNKLIDLGTENDYILGPTIGGMRVNRFIEGQPLGVFWGLKCDGVIQTWEEALSLEAQPGAVPGEYIFENLYNGEDYQVINERDMTIIGDPNPDFVFGFNSSFTYKRLNLDILLNGQLGGDIFWYDYSMMLQQNQNYNSLSTALSDAWIAPIQYTLTGKDGKTYTIGSSSGTIGSATLPSARARDSYIAGTNKVYRNGLHNSSNIFDASFIRLANISLGYTFTFRKYLQSLKLSFSASNIFTITSYPGYDPETSSYVKDPMRQGIDLGAYPSSRTFSFSCNLVF